MRKNDKLEMVKQAKYFIVFLSAVLIVSCGPEEKPQAKTLFNKYASVDHFNMISIHPSVFLVVEDPEHQDLQSAIKKLDDIKVLSHEISGDDAGTTRQFLSDIKLNFPETEYKDLMVVKEGKERIVFKIKEEGSIVSELVMQLIDENSITVALLTGDIDLDQVTQLAGKLDLADLKKLDFMKAGH